ncbi:MAG TPA: FAD-binding oxidoreductase [Thermoanaerobaculia bacterium]|nr:FAD-binding oxidoreductase [Thermoanaerobaculia bacterium]
MLNRREFLKAAALTALSPAACVTTPRAARAGQWVNDIHSQLNRTFVSAVHAPRGIDDLRRILRGGEAVCLSGGRHAMGGQQFASATPLIDIRGMNHILGFDRQNGIVEVESGIEWPELITYLVDAQRGQTAQWGIAQKQTGADRLTLGGGLAANVHGRGLTMKPIAGDVESFTMVDAAGELIECSRTRNRELFALAIGGYGLFGAIGSIRLRLTPRRKVERVVEEKEIDTIAAAFQNRIDEGYLYGDFQFAIDAGEDNFLRSGVFSCYRPVADDSPLSAGQAELKPEDWIRLLYLAHADKKQAYQRYVDYYMATSGQVYWSDEHQLSFYPDDYHLSLDRTLDGPAPATEIISELYVPLPRLADFMMAAREVLRRENVSVVYGTVRLIERDDDTFLAWAKQRYACVIFNLHTPHTDDGQRRSADAFRALIDLALARDGSYFLTYHRYARRDQVEAAYPQFEEFLRRKRAHDPAERFQSEWYRYYRSMFG